MYRYYYTYEKLKNFEHKNPRKHLSFDLLAFLQIQYNNSIGICIFFVWIKLFKFISFNKTMSQFITTLSRVNKIIYTNIIVVAKKKLK